MGVLNLKEGNTTIMFMTTVMMFFIAYVSLVWIGWLPVNKLFVNPLGVGIMAGAIGIILLLETWFEGTKPDFKDFVSPELKNSLFLKLNTLVGLLFLGVSFFILFGKTMPTWIFNILGYAGITAFFLLIRELFLGK